MNLPIYQNHTKVYIFNKEEEEARQQTYKSQTPTGIQRLDDDLPLQRADDYLSPDFSFGTSTFQKEER